MADTHQRDRARAQAWQQLCSALEQPQRASTIHYALQRLQRSNEHGEAPVAAIAIRDLADGASHVFSIKREAALAGIDLSAAPSRQTLAALEYALLFKFNEHLSRAPDRTFIHWYMRDERFGFAALENRYRKSLSDLNETLFGARSAATASPYGFTGAASPFPVRVPHDNRIDLARLLRDLYGIGPVRLRELSAANGLWHAEMLDGINEPEMFERGNHARLEWSSASKARLIAEISGLAYGGKLRTPAPARGSASGQRQPSDQGGIRIFINYRREDTEAAANWLHELLSEGFGDDNVFIDTDDIPAGLDYVDVLRRQIESCDVFLSMIGRQWLRAADDQGRARLGNPNDFVRAEIRAALARDIPVIPVLVEGTRLPAEVELPTDLLPLRRRQSVELRSREFRQDVERLVAKIRQSATTHRTALTTSRTG